jgi:hypothetical protein
MHASAQFGEDSSFLRHLEEHPTFRRLRDFKIAIAVLKAGLQICTLQHWFQI